MATFRLSSIEYVDVITVGVLAGVYRGGLKCELEDPTVVSLVRDDKLLKLLPQLLKLPERAPRHFLTHLVFRGPNEVWIQSGCRQPMDNLADECLAGLDSRPTCPSCAKKYDKIKGGT